MEQIVELKAGDKAPEFSAADQDGKVRKLSDYKGKRLILYFYPKDNTPGCTAEACSLRDGRQELQDMGFEVVGVSPDSEKSHQKFIADHGLNFTLLSDTDHAVASAYGVWAMKKMAGRSYMGILRTTFIISPEGVIEKIFDKVNTKDHFEQIVESYK